MEQALTLFGASLFLLTVLTILFRVEDSFGGRIVLSSTRSVLDRAAIALKTKLTLILKAQKLSKIRLVWHFLLHQLLKRLQSFFDFVSGKMKVWQNKNKAAAKAVTSTGNKSHLNEIAEHKQKTALTETEKQKRKSYE